MKPRYTVRNSRGRVIEHFQHIVDARIYYDSTKKRGWFIQHEQRAIDARNARGLGV